LNRKPRLHSPAPTGGEELDSSFQILSPNLPAKDRPGPGDEFFEDENGKQKTPGELASAVRLTVARIAQMQANADAWLEDPNAFALFAARQAAIAIQIGADVMTGTFIGPSANQQRLAAAQFVVKESQSILNTVLKRKGLDGAKAK
jgi:hypothetical protein